MWNYDISYMLSEPITIKKTTAKNKQKKLLKQHYNPAKINNNTTIYTSPYFFPGTVNEYWGWGKLGNQSTGIKGSIRTKKLDRERERQTK